MLPPADKWALSRWLQKTSLALGPCGPRGGFSPGLGRCGWEERPPDNVASPLFRWGSGGGQHPSPLPSGPGPLLAEATPPAGARKFSSPPSAARACSPEQLAHLHLGSQEAFSLPVALLQASARHTARSALGSWGRHLGLSSPGSPVSTLGLGTGDSLCSHLIDGSYSAGGSAAPYELCPQGWQR